jgi:lipopolysaccharide export LptBFGC system permease protein LptF
MNKKKKKQEAILFGTVISGILIASLVLSISSQLIQEVRAQNMTNQPRINATRTTIPPLSPSCCPSNGYIANAGPDKTELEGTIITLNGSSNNDNSSNVGNTANYLWRQTDGPAVILNDNNTAHPTFVAPNYPNDTKYTFALEVSENQVINNNQTGSAIDTVDIVVKDANIEAKNPRSLQEEGNADE